MIYFWRLGTKTPPLPLTPSPLHVRHERRTCTTTRTNKKKEKKRIGVDNNQLRVRPLIPAPVNQNCQTEILIFLLGLSSKKSLQAIQFSSKVVSANVPFSLPISHLSISDFQDLEKRKRADCTYERGRVQSASKSSILPFVPGLS